MLIMSPAKIAPLSRGYFGHLSLLNLNQQWGQNQKKQYTRDRPYYNQPIRKKDSGLGVQQKNCGYSSNLTNEVFACIFPVKRKLPPYLNVPRA